MGSQMKNENGVSSVPRETAERQSKAKKMYAAFIAGTLFLIAAAIIIPLLFGNESNQDMLMMYLLLFAVLYNTVLRAVLTVMTYKIAKELNRIYNLWAAGAVTMPVIFPIIIANMPMKEEKSSF